MRQPKPFAGARALLFDRLVHHHSDDDEAEDQGLRILDRDQLKASVRRELGQLLNTRCSLPLELVAETERSVINYGLPDFSSLSPQSADDRALIATIVTQTVLAFEPRLRQVRVVVERIEDSEWGLWMDIHAELVVGLYTEPVVFPALYNSKDGAAEVA